MLHRNSQRTNDQNIGHQGSQEFVHNHQEEVLEVLRDPTLAVDLEVARRVEEHLTQKDAADEEVRVDGERSVFEDQVDQPI